MFKFAVSLILLSLSCASTLAAALTPDQQEDVKLKSIKWIMSEEKADALVKEKKYAEAEAIYKQILTDRQSLGLDLFTEYQALGSLYMSSGQRNEAMKTYQAMVSNREQLNGLNDQRVIYPLKQLADCLTKIGKTGEAKGLLRRAASIQRNVDTIPRFSKLTTALGPSARIAEGQKMRVLGEQALASELQAKARAYFERAVELNPNDAVALCDRAETEEWMNQFRKASLDLNKAIELKPNLRKAYVDRAFHDENMHKYPQAIADFDKALALESNDADTMGSKAKLLDEMGKHKESVETYTKLIDSNPKLYWPYIQRSVAYSALGQHKEAIADLTTVVNRAPEDTDYLEYRADAYIKADDFQKAAADYTQIIELNPKNSSYYHRRAQVYEKLDGKKTDRVMSDYSMAKKLGYN